MSSDDERPSADDVTEDAAPEEIYPGVPARGGLAAEAAGAAGDETGAEGVQGPDAAEVQAPEVEAAVAPAEPAAAAEAEAPAPAAAEEEAEAPATVPEQPAAEAEPAAEVEALPVEAEVAADDAVAEETPVAAEEKAAPQEDAAEAEPEEPLDEARQAVLDALAEALGEAVVDTWVGPGGDIWVRVRREDWRRTAEVVRNDLGFTYFCFLSAIDWLPSPFGKSEDDVPRTQEAVDTAVAGAMGLEHGVTGGETRFQILARVFSIARRVGLVLKADLPDDDLAIDTWTGIYPGANWHERETREMFGIAFAGHPYMVNLYLPGAFEGYPLRKDFPLLAREVKPWPGVVDVEAMPGESAEDAAASDPLAGAEA